MKHPDLRPLVWGHHLQQLLGACRVTPHAEPTPRLAQPMPLWFRRVAAALTLLGLIGAIRVVDSQITDAVAPNSAALRDPAPFDPETWNAWAAHLGFGLATQAVLGETAENLRVIGAGDPGVLASELAAPAPVPPDETSRGPARSHGFRFQLIQVTAYTSCGTETDTSPHLTASGHQTSPGTIALSRDLLRQFTPGAPFSYGDKVLVPGVGVFVARDTMHPKWKRKADIWFPTKAQARAWGRRTVFVTRVSPDAPLMAQRVTRP